MHQPPPLNISLPFPWKAYLLCFCFGAVTASLQQQQQKRLQELYRQVLCIWLRLLQALLIIQSSNPQHITDTNWP